MKFDNSFRRLPEFFWENVTPTALKNPRLIHTTELLKTFDWNLSDKELCFWLNGETTMAGEQRISTRYAGHQFGVWAGQLGDGRAISLGEVLTSEGRLEIQTKGSGLTPFSRMGDGKAVIRSSVREYLCSEAMQGLGIPTTRVLALITGEDEVVREQIERSALVARVFPTNLRFGHFEMCYHFDRKAELSKLIDYTRHTFFDGVSVEKMLTTIVDRTARLMARWQSVGFCHGVMNTDNMSILGLTIDYGPFGFLEDTVLNFVCNHSDHQGRYAYNRQPNVAMWNLERLLVCFLDTVPREKLEAILVTYPQVFEAELMNQFGKKLGLSAPATPELVNSLMAMLDFLNLDFTYFFRQLSRYEKGRKESLKALWDYYGERQELIEWLKTYDGHLSDNDQARSSRMLKANPKFVLKNYIAQEVIDEVEADESQKLKNVLNILYSPFDEHSEFERYALPTPPALKALEISCSS